MDDEIERSCATCRAWMPRGIGTLEPGHGRDRSMGECRRLAPTVMMIPVRDAGGGHSMPDTDPDFDLVTARSRTTFPVTLSVDWCRQWRIDQAAWRAFHGPERSASSCSA